MPSVTEGQLQILIYRVDNLRDECIPRLLFDSGMRLSELTNIKCADIDRGAQTITIIGKGNKQRRAPLTDKTGELLRLYLSDNHSEGNIWGRYVRYRNGAEEIKSQYGD